MRRQKTDPTVSVSQRRRSLSDPLAAALRPPENETPDERERRLNAEEEARRVSDGIDAMIRAEKKEKRVKQEIKVLLLGQSESGKSTTLKRESIVGLPLSCFRRYRSGHILHAIGQ
jgi:polynucleotide 5'-kinase involved in rRNA processing